MGPKKNPFKVNTVRSIKLKNKAKAYVTKLKSLKELSKKKVDEVDVQLKSFQELVYQQSKGTKPQAASAFDSKEKKMANEKLKEEYKKTENNEKEILNKLDSMEL